MKARLHKINTDIKQNQVRLVGNGEPVILSTTDALNIARSKEMDLILISETTEIPVVRIEEYTKFLFNIEKKLKEQKKNSIKNEIKEIKLSCEIDDNDLNTKAKKAIEFLTDNMKVKCLIQLKGRQNLSPERGELVMYKFAELVSAVGMPEAYPKLESSKMNMMIKPKVKK